MLNMCLFLIKWKKTLKYFKILKKTLRFEKKFGKKENIKYSACVCFSVYLKRKQLISTTYTNLLT